jgi:predicted small metal-binding protein
MRNILRCELLFDGCPERIEGDTEEEIVAKAREHARREHGVEELDEQREAALMAGIRKA